MRDGFVPIGGERAEKRTVSFHTTIVGGPGNERVHTLTRKRRNKRNQNSGNCETTTVCKCEGGRFRFLFLHLVSDSAKEEGIFLFSQLSNDFFLFIVPRHVTMLAKKPKARFMCGRSWVFFFLVKTESSSLLDNRSLAAAQKRLQSYFSSFHSSTVVFFPG